jgi:hypothetical protein
MWGYGLDLTSSGYRQVAGTCECGNEPSGSIKCGEFLDSYKPVSFSRRILLRGVSKYNTSSPRRKICDVRMDKMKASSPIN